MKPTTDSLTVSQAAQFLNISPSTLRRLTAAGQVPTVPGLAVPGSRGVVRYSRSVIQALLHPTTAEDRLGKVQRHARLVSQLRSHGLGLDEGGNVVPL